MPADKKPSFGVFNVPDIETSDYCGPDRRKIKWFEHERMSWALIFTIVMQAGMAVWWLKGLSSEVEHLAQSTERRFNGIEQRVDSHYNNGITKLELDSMFALRDLQIQHHSEIISELKDITRQIKAGVDHLIAAHENREGGLNGRGGN